MERIAKLVAASTAVRRKIWASLQFSVRLADFFGRLASMTTDAFGKVIYAEFILRGVEDMPPVHGKPVSELPHSKSIANKLPPGYGREFGKKAFLVMMGKLHNPQQVEELMSEFLVNFLESGSKHLREGVTLHEAHNYVLRALQNAIIDWLRKKREVSDSMGGEDAHSIYDVTPTFDEESAEKLFDERMLPKVRTKLRGIHPSAEQYIKLSLIEGYTDREILGDPAHGVPSLLEHPLTSSGLPLTEKSWSTSYKPKIFSVLKNSFEDLVHHAV